MSKLIDFTNSKRVYGKAYNGANGKKISVIYSGTRYMLKFPPSGERKPTDLSYTNSCISEYIACHIFNLLGVPAQDTLLGTFQIGEKTKIVCACKDFTVKAKQLYDFCSIKNTIIDSETNGNGTELEEILETIEKQLFVEPSMLLEHFWDVFIVDALLGNFDRHNGNWGFLYDLYNDTSEIAPVYACGSCLLPQADEKIIRGILGNEDMLHARIFQFPTSAIKLNGRKLNYYDYLTTTDNLDCQKALLRIFPRIDFDKINTIINDIPCITDLQKDFYRVYIKARYDSILKPAFEKILP